MVESEERTGGRRVLPALAVTLGVIGAAATGTTGFAARADAQAASRNADALEIVGLRSELRRTHLEEANTLLLSLYGEATAQDVEDARDARIAAREVALERARGLADGSGPVAFEAQFLVELLTGDRIADVRDADPIDLLDSGHDAVHAGRPPAAQYDDATLALYDLMKPDVAGALVVNDALDATYVLVQPEVPELLVAYVGESEPYIRSDGGYLGPDPEAPLFESYVYDATASLPHPALTRVSDGIASSDLWAYDQWIRSWQLGTPQDPAPLTLSELVVQARLVDGNTRGIVDTTLGDARHEFQEAASSASLRSTALLVLSALFAIASIVALVVFVRGRWQQVRRVAEGIGRDPLTGVGNRHALEQRVAPALRDPSLGWHLVAAVDMDRFKLINDTWGHAVGDRVLVAVAERLTAIVEELEETDDILSGSVVRLGGDEFLMALHSVEPFELDTVRAMLEEIRTASIEVVVDETDDAHESVALMFSLGMAESTGPCELDDLMRAADLAAYEEKSERAEQLPDRRRPEASVESADSSELASEQLA